MSEGGYAPFRTSPRKGCAGKPALGAVASARQGASIGDSEMTLSRAERDMLIQRYAEGPARLKVALAAVPAAAVQWRPAPGEWSAHEVVVHCADSETNAAARIRYLTAEQEPLVLGYDEAEWARRFDYHSHPLDTAL